MKEELCVVARGIQAARGSRIKSRSAGAVRREPISTTCKIT